MEMEGPAASGNGTEPAARRRVDYFKRLARSAIAVIVLVVIRHAGLAGVVTDALGGSSQPAPRVYTTGDSFTTTYSARAGRYLHDGMPVRYRSRRVGEVAHHHLAGGVERVTIVVIPTLDWIPEEGHMIVLGRAPHPFARLIRRP